MRRSMLLTGIASAVLVSAAVIPAQAQAAPVGFSVVIVAHTVFGAEASEFDSTLPGCESGTVADDGAAHFTPWGGAFVGLKHFTCADGESGFTVRLNARFGGGGSTGTWTLADAWGDFAGVKGSGSLVGVPTSDTSIDDTYTGTVR
jgi:hypothetical protein